MEVERFKVATLSTSEEEGGRGHEPRNAALELEWGMRQIILKIWKFHGPAKPLVSAW